VRVGALVIAVRADDLDGGHTLHLLLELERLSFSGFIIMLAVVQWVVIFI